MSMTASLRRWAGDGYYRLARRQPSFARLHNYLRRRQHRRRYGVDSSFMFKVVELEVNSMCNRKCSYCPNATARRPSGFMPQELFDKIIGELAEIDFDGRVSYHFYGEPLLDKRLPDLIETTARRVPKAKTEIYSNGDFLTVPVFREYRARGLGHFLITQHDNLMPPNLQELVDTLTPEEKGHLTIRFAKDRFMINRSGHVQGLGVVNEPLKAACDWPLTTMVVTLQGNVVLCCNDYFEDEVVGNLRTQTLREVWTGAAFTALRAALARGDRTKSHLCVECDYVPAPTLLRRIVPPTDER